MRAVFRKVTGLLYSQRATEKYWIDLFAKNMAHIRATGRLDAIQW